MKYPVAEGGAPDQRWDLAEYALSFSNERRVSESTAARCYGFTIATHHFLLEEGQAAELVSQPVFTPMPNTPEHCLGLANVRGNIVPYYTLRIFVDSATDRSCESHRYALLLGDVTNGVLLAIDGKPSAVPLDSLTMKAETFSRTGGLPGAVLKRELASPERCWLMLDTQQLIRFLATTDPSQG